MEDAEQEYSQFQQNMSKGRDTSINSSFKGHQDSAPRRPTFTKKVQKEQDNYRKTIGKDQTFYKSAQEAIVEVKQFLCLMYGSIIRFYNTTIRLSVLEQMKEDIIELISKLVFNETMTNLVTALCRICTKEEERTLTFKLTELGRVTTAIIGLEQHFTLEEKSSMILEIYKAQTTPVIEEEAVEDDGDVGGSRSKEEPSAIVVNPDEGSSSEEQKQDGSRAIALTQVIETEEAKESGDFIEKPKDLLAEIRERLKKAPYQTSIDLLQKIQSVHEPIAKARCVSEMSSEIVKSITDFWAGITVNEDQITIAADSLILVYIYIIIQAHVLDIFAQIRFINEYLTPHIKSSKLGYCITTLEIAAAHINSLAKEELLIGQLTESDQFFAKASRTGSTISEARQSLRESLRRSVSI